MSGTGLLPEGLTPALVGEERLAGHDAGYALGDAHGFDRGWREGREAMLAELRAESVARVALNTHPGTPSTPESEEEGTSRVVNAPSGAAGMGSTESLPIPPDPAEPRKAPLDSLS